jgi:Tfp pilus assembly protein PilO
MGRYILPTLLLVIAIGSFVVLTNPLYGEIRVLQEEQSAYDNALANSKQLHELREVLIEKQNQFSPRDIQDLERMIPVSVDNIGLAIEIQKMGEAEGLIVESVQYDPTANQENSINTTTNTNSLYDVFELDISAEGTYGQFVGFLEQIEESLRIVDIVKVEFSSESSFINTDVYTYNIVVKTYRLRD